MPDALPDPSLTHTIDTHPSGLPERGAGVGWREHAATTELEAQLHEAVESVICWRDRHDEIRREANRLAVELAKRDETIAKLYEASGRHRDTIMGQTRQLDELREIARQSGESADESSRHAGTLEKALEVAEQQNAELRMQKLELERKVGRLEKEVAASDETFRWASETEAKVQQGIADLQATIASLRSRLENAETQLAAEEAWNLDTAKRLDALVRGVDWIGMGVTAEELHRLADEARKPRMTFVASPSPASQHAKLVRLVEAAKGAVDEYHANYAGMKYEDAAMKRLVAALADLGPIAEEAP